VKCRVFVLHRPAVDEESYIRGQEGPGARARTAARGNHNQNSLKGETQQFLTHRRCWLAQVRQIGDAGGSWMKRGDECRTLSSSDSFYA
jgi:hypothetical protein